MNNTIGWELYRSFLGVLQEGSLSGAARSLGLTQPTVGRHISALEEALGQSLFTRSQAGLLPTEAALALRGHAEAMHHTAASMERVARAFGNEVRGSVRISASEVVGVEVLPAILATLRQSHPQLDVELVLSNRLADVVQREVDIAVRMAAPQQDVLVATRVRDVGLGLHAHRAYLARHGTPSSLADLEEHTLIGFDTEAPFLRGWLERLSLPGREHFAFRCDSDLAQLALIRSGAGIGMCQVAVARTDPQLVSILPKVVSANLPMWVVMHSDLRNNRRCKVVYEALVKGLRRT